MNFSVNNIKDLSEAQFNAAFDKMNSERQKRCLRFKFIDDRRRMVFGYELLSKMLAEKYKVSEEEVEITNLPSGKPVAMVKGKEVFVSISHSGDFVASAVSDTPVGVDLEVIREFKPSVLKALSDEEQEFIEKSKDKSSAFLKIWTAKEAYLKLTGEGLKGFSKADVLPVVKNGKWDGLVLKGVSTEDYYMTIVYKK